MADAQQTIRIGILLTDTPVPAVLAARGTYGAIFHALVTAAASRFSPHLHIESREFDVVAGAYPPWATDFNALLITGSAASAYDDAPWIRVLEGYLRRTYETCSGVRLFGSCFGHQILCHALLKEHGVGVVRDPAGWEIGVRTVRLTNEFRAAWTASSSKSGTKDELKVPSQLRLQMMHADSVVLPGSQSNPNVTLPHPWILLGSTPQCAVQGVYCPGRVLTYQGHFEFDRFVNAETVGVFGTRWEAVVLQAALQAVEAEDDDAERAADMVVRFLLEGHGEGGRGRGCVFGSVARFGLLTPPLE